MSRMWLVTSNDRKLLPCVLTAAGIVEEKLTAQAPSVYGAAVFASGSNVLTLKRPVSHGSRLAGFDGEDIRSNRFLGLLDTTDGVFRSEDTQPFRHKGWVVAQCGDAPPQLDYPENSRDAQFLRDNVRGNTPSEFLCHAVLARMYRMHPHGPESTDPGLIAADVEEVLQHKALKKYRNWSIVVTCEGMGVVMAKGREVKYRTVRRVKRCSRCTIGRHTVSHSHLSAVVVVDGIEVSGKEWKTLPAERILVVGPEPPARLLKARTS